MYKSVKKFIGTNNNSFRDFKPLPILRQDSTKCFKYQQSLKGYRYFSVQDTAKLKVTAQA